jgi:hypothetical protein
MSSLESGEADLATGTVEIRETSKTFPTMFDQTLIMNVGYTLVTGNAALAEGMGRKVARTFPPWIKSREAAKLE